MGEVWAGVHHEQGVPVAIKVMTGAKARDEGFLATFRNEVRAVASLHHPGVVLVFDYGEVGADAEAATGGELVAGSPYLAMERASRGSLEQLVAPGAQPLRWSELRRVLVAVLDALAHAHARGIIHRDLKPANVLVCAENDARPGLKLTDFGLAHALDEAPVSSGQVFSGTPNYMSPEQIQCHWRDYGPWTDLYAVGCLAFELASGRLAFSGDGLPGVLNAHLAHLPSALIPRRPAPEGFARWVARLYDRDPRRRFQCAADAAWALLRLGDVEDLDGLPDDGPAGSSAGADDDASGPGGAATLETLIGPTSDDAATLMLPEELTIRDLTPPIDLRPATRAERPAGDIGLGATLHGELPMSEQADVPRADDRPPVPETWRRPEGAGPSMRITGAGLGLFGLREIPLVDREPERDALWLALRKVEAEGRVGCVVLQGPVGSGKSRLAEWLCQRAHEVGAATTMRAAHAPTPEPGDGLRGMLARFIRSHGLDREETRDRAERLMRTLGSRDYDEWLAVTEVIHPTPLSSLHTGGPQIRFGSPRERHLAVYRLIQRMAARRPAVVWLDDVQWGVDALGFAVEALAERDARPAPVLLMLTAQEEGLADRPGEAERLAQVLAHPATVEVHVGALNREHRPALVRALLGLEGELATQVEARTEGNPLFAVQLVGDWVHRGLLELGDSGFRLRPGADAELPDDVHHVWRGRINRLLEGRPEGDGRALELAAVLGQQVDEPEWREVCGIAAIPYPAALAGALVEQRLARAHQEGRATAWAFVHGMLRESLVRRAQEHRRWDDHNRACAAMLEGRAGPGVFERLAGHLLAAEEWERALQPLLDGARERMTEGAYTASEGLLDRRSETLERARVGPDDALWGEGWVVRAALERQRVRLDDAVVWAERALAAAEAHGWAGVRAEALLERGVLARLMGDAERAGRLLGEAEAWAGVIGETRLLADCHRERGDACLRQDDLPAAQAQFRRAAEEYGALGDDEGAGKCHRGLAGVARQAGRLDEAGPELEQALSCFQRCGSRWGVAVCANDLGELARLAGDLPAAAARYREALGRYASVGSGNAVFPEINLGIVLVEEGRHAEARAVLTTALATVSAQGRRPLMGAVHAFLLPCSAGLGEWPAWADHLQAASTLLAESDFVDVDIATAVERAGDLAVEAAGTDGARQAYAVALAQWTALDRRVQVEAVRGKLARLGA